MASKSLVFLGLLVAIVLVLYSDMAVSAARSEPGVATETKGDVNVDGGGHHYYHHHHHHHCHHCDDDNKMDDKNDERFDEVNNKNHN
ncbi:NEDD8-specific protease 1-like [Andrographis paniculata]|uniref:NEDD8-specific protease 1-like n=1 Tax=Andrographis paniculata TaxID=175694 RepID=UPI0021E83C7B|nr:NEDD8-specific protease 1-like [Andrographis paniculata]